MHRYETDIDVVKGKIRLLMPGIEETLAEKPEFVSQQALLKWIELGPLKLDKIA